MRKYCLSKKNQWKKYAIQATYFQLSYVKKYKKEKAIQITNDKYTVS